MTTAPDFIYRATELLSTLVRCAVHSGERDQWAVNLGLQKTDGLHQIISALDLLNDTTSAIESFLKFGLDGPTKYRDTGEAYLRLYGVLNAIYLQQKTIVEFWRLATNQKKEIAEQKFIALQIRDVRRKLGAHSINFGNHGRTESFAPIQNTVHGLSCQYINNSNDKFESFDFERGIKDHYSVAVDLLFAAVDTLFTKASFESDDKKQEALNQLNDLRFIHQGGLVVENMAGTKLRLTTDKRITR